jgi:pimeloyl-ACP methyl ester carboxylesterase
VSKPNVIILHGIGLSSWHTAHLAKHLRSTYTVHNLSYPSRQFVLDELVQDLRQKLISLAIENELCHFVGYSMGGILSRAYLRAYPPVAGTKVVQVGSPNGGSEVADYFRSWWLYKFLFGPAGAQLTTDSEYLKELRTTESNYALGVIAGLFKYDPIGRFCIPGPNDGKVSVESTRIASMNKHTIVPVSHFSMPYSQRVQWQVKSFLDREAFLSL